MHPLGLVAVLPHLLGQPVVQLPSLTRLACAFSVVSSPRIRVKAGPAAGNLHDGVGLEPDNRLGQNWVVDAARPLERLRPLLALEARKSHLRSEIDPVGTGAVVGLDGLGGNESARRPRTVRRVGAMVGAWTTIIGRHHHLVVRVPSGIT